MGPILRVKSAGRSFVVLVLCMGMITAMGSAAASRSPAAGDAAAGLAASNDRSGVAGVEPQGIGFGRIVGGLRRPLYVTHAGDDRLFVVEQAGRIRIVRKEGGDWQITGTFLNIKSRVGDAYTEQGLLGLAFHPDYETNGLFYVDYTDNRGDSIIAEFQRDTFGRADPGSFRRVMKINQPYVNHNGGWIGFKGPYLYIAKGDGGAAGDPGDRAQDLDTRLGKILRIDPLDPAGPKDFSVPASNPFVGKPGLDIIWSYGLRNPWRGSHDRLTGDLWIGDVGQDRYEEVDHAGDGSGRNFGWDRLEGRHLYPSGALCMSNCKTLPIFEYRHHVSGADNCSVTGGYVSRRPGADIYGQYIFADLCSRRVWLLPASHELGDPVAAPYPSGRLISSFGEDQDGRIFLTDLNGALYRVNGS